MALTTESVLSVLYRGHQLLTFKTLRLSPLVSWSLESA